MKKLETVFSVFLVGLFLLPSFSFGQNAWVGPTAPFSSTVPAPELPVDQSSSINTKPGLLELDKLDLTKGLTRSTQIFSPIILGMNQGLLSGTSKVSFNDGGLFNVFAPGLILPNQGQPASGFVAGTIYYDSTAKEVKLYDGTAWKSIGSGSGVGSSSQWADVGSFGIEYTGGKVRINPASNPELQFKYGAGTTKYWALSSSLVDARSSTFKISNGSGTDIVLIKYNDDTGKGSVNLGSDISLCFNGGATPNTDCKKAWPASGGTAFNGLLQGPDLTLRAAAGTPEDSGDVIFQNSSSNQKARIWSKPSAGAALNFSSGDNISDLTIDSNGSVGVGTETPDNKLSVVGGYLGVELNSSEGPALVLKNPKKTADNTGNRWAIYNMTDGYTNSLQFWRYDTRNCPDGCISPLIIKDDGKLVIGSVATAQNGEELGWKTPSKVYTYDGALHYYWNKIVKLNDINSHVTFQVIAKNDINFAHNALYSVEANRFYGGIDPNITRSVSLAVNKISGTGGAPVYATIDSQGYVWIKAIVEWDNFVGYKILNSRGIQILEPSEVTNQENNPGAWEVGPSKFVRATFPDLQKDEINSGYSDIVVSKSGNIGISTDNPTDKLSIENGSIFVKGGNLKFETVSPPASTLITTPVCNAGGNLPSPGAGNNYYYSISYATVVGSIGGETSPSPTTQSCGSGGNTTVTFNVNSVSNPAVSEIRIYRGVAVASQNLNTNYVVNNFRYVGSISNAGGAFTDNIADVSGNRKPSPVNTSAGGIFVKEQTQNNYRQVIGFSRTDNKTFVDITGQITGTGLDGDDTNTNHGPLRIRWVDTNNSNGVGAGWYPYAVYAP